MDDQLRMDTLLVHAGEPEPRASATSPIHRSTVWATEGGGSYHDIPYPRLNNLPNQTALATKLAAIEGAEAALVTASGMAAISTTLLSVLRHGDHLLVQDSLYGGTHAFVTEDLSDMGVEVDAIDTADPASWATKVRPSTRAVYVEALTNPLLKVIDHRALVAFAKQAGLVSIIDATFATPVNFRPVEHGYDLVVHSATKYLGGHSDLTAGAVAGRAERIERVHTKLNHFGGNLDPEGVFLLGRGLRTLGLRVRHQNQSAQRLATVLDAHPEVARVHYPGLPEHHNADVAKALFAGCGGMLSFELAGGTAAAAALMSAVRLPMVAPSLGGPETLLTLPARTSHLSLTPEERQRAGIADGLIRMSVGLEDPEDLVADFERGLAAVRAACGAKGGVR
ncbi:MAG: PLP-dependent aspartate aminotransferase family protein [Planctomycetota bacterium]